MNTSDDNLMMARALQLAKQGEGSVEPNPMVGCVVVNDGQVVGEGWHQVFGGPHAEVNALQAAADAAAGATLFVTLEPCCHQGKTPPCAKAVIDAGIKRVVIAHRDPFPRVDGGGIQVLRAAGIEVVVGVLEEQSRHLNAPYLKRVATSIPWVIAKWAMTLDGKIATRTGDSQWISNAASRAIVHQLRGRCDAIIVGSGTAQADDPTLTARPAGARIATRVVLDSSASLAVKSKLIKTIDLAPVVVAATANAPAKNVQRLRDAGCEVLFLDGESHEHRLESLLRELGSRNMTNVLVEGGAQVLGSFHDANAIDEVHVFVASKTVGGSMAASPIGGSGVAAMAAARRLSDPTISVVDGDVYLRGRTTSASSDKQSQ